MSTITPIAWTDVQSTSRAIINTNFDNLNTDKADKVVWLQQFASTTSDQLNGVISDSVGTWALVFGNSLWWIYASETWTYASANTFTVPWDLTTKYQRGDRIKLTQTTVKYFTVLKVAYWASTTITITGGTDYTLANAAITDNYYSKELSPQGYPDWFNYTPTWTGFSSPPTTSSAKFTIDWNTCTIAVACSGNWTSNATGMTLSTPNSIISNGAFHWSVGYPVDNWTALSYAFAYILNSWTTIIFAKTMDTTSTWTWSGGKRAEVTISFQFTL